MRDSSEPSCAISRRYFLRLSGVGALVVALWVAGSENLFAQVDSAYSSLVEEFEAKDRSGELLLAVVALCQSLCFTTAKLAHALEDQLTNEEVLDLTDGDVRAAALEVVRAYARAAAPTDDVASA